MLQNFCIQIAQLQTYKHHIYNYFKQTTTLHALLIGIQLPQIQLPQNGQQGSKIQQ